jgi:hypothetical protein
MLNDSPNPFSIDETSVFEERRISEFHGAASKVGGLIAKRAGGGEAEFAPQAGRLRIIEMAPAITAKTASMISPPSTAWTK